MRRFTLKAQYIAGMCGLILGVSLALVFSLSIQFNRQLDYELNKRGASIARSLADAALKPIITENYIALQLLVRDLKRHEDDIHYLYIVNNRNQVLAHTFAGAFPARLLQMDRPLASDGKPLFNTFSIGSEEFDDVTVNIQGGAFGRVHVGLTKELLKAEKKEMILGSAPLICLILLVGSGGAWWFALRIIRPIAILSDNVKKVAEGQFGSIIEIQSRDELGELTASFNTMTLELRNRTDMRLKVENELRRQKTLLEKEVSERQAAQQQLKVLNRSLEDRVDQALSELRAKDRVMLAQGRQAAMGEMINNIAHQWRQPLNNMGLIVQNIKFDHECGTMTREGLASDVDNVMNIILFMSQTINDFSSFFSPDAEKKRFVISEGLDKVIAMVGASLSRKGIRLVVEKLQDNVAINGFYNEYNQVLLNLISNAKDALTENNVPDPCITITIARRDGNAVVTVRDNGGGIPEEIIGKIFTPYFTTKSPGKGSGIGLYMSQTIIQEHFGGSLSAANVDGGAELTIITPLAPLQPPADMPQGLVTA